MGEGKRQRQGHVFCLEDLKVGMQVTRTIWSLGSYKRQESILAGELTHRLKILETNPTLDQKLVITLTKLHSTYEKVKSE